MIQRIFRLLFIFGVILAPAALSADDSTSARNPRFGPYEAIHLDPAVIRGVQVDDALRIYLKFHPPYDDRELIIRLSNAYKAGYRPWADGAMEFVAPATRGSNPDVWGDWIQSKANFIEYWVEGRLVLHLKRMQS